MWIQLWDVCCYEVVSCVVNLSVELAALSLMSRARLPRLHRQAFVSMGWTEGANMRAILTLTLNMETANSPQD